MEPGSIPGANAGFLGPSSYGGMPYSALMQRGGTWSCLNLTCQAFLIPLGRPDPF